MTLRILPAIFAFVLLAAHFLRAGHIGLVLLCILIPFLLLIKSGWALILVRVLTYLGVLVWLQTTVVLVYHRWEVDEPWMRMFAILVGVAVFTGLAAHLLGSEKVSKRYH